MNNIKIRCEKPFPNLRLGVRLYTESMPEYYDFWSKRGVELKFNNKTLPKVMFYDILTCENGDYNKLVNLCFKIESPIEIKNYLYSFIGSTKLINDYSDYPTYWWNIDLQKFLMILSYTKDQGKYPELVDEFIRELNFITNVHTGDFDVFSNMFKTYGSNIDYIRYIDNHFSEGHVGPTLVINDDRILSLYLNSNDIQLYKHPILENTYLIPNECLSANIDFIKKLFCNYINGDDYLKHFLIDQCLFSYEDNFYLFPCGGDISNCIRLEKQLNNLSNHNNVCPFLIECSDYLCHDGFIKTNIKNYLKTNENNKYYKLIKSENT